MNISVLETRKVRSALIPVEKRKLSYSELGKGDSERILRVSLIGFYKRLLRRPIANEKFDRP